MYSYTIVDFRKPPYRDSVWVLVKNTGPTCLVSETSPVILEWIQVREIHLRLFSTYLGIDPNSWRDIVGLPMEKRTFNSNYCAFILAFADLLGVSTVGFPENTLASPRFDPLWMMDF